MRPRVGIFAAIVAVVGVSVALLLSLPSKEDYRMGRLGEVESFRDVITIVNRGETYPCSSLFLLERRVEKFNNLILEKQKSGQWDNVALIPAPKGCVKAS